MPADVQVSCDPASGRVRSLTLYGVELLDPAAPAGAELAVNGLPLALRPYPDPRERQTDPARRARFKGERFVDHFTGWSLTLSRSMGARPGAAHPCFGVQYRVRREPADQTALPCPGPGGPVIEAPLYVDSFSLLTWPWRFWGDATRMIFPSTHSSGPSDEFGHLGYEHDTPERAKAFLQNVWRRIYPGVMALHGGMFYDARTGHWLALTCRRPHVGYILNLETAGRGVGYDFTLHAPFALGEALTLPEIILYYGPDAASMWAFMADYVTHYYREAPDWVYRTLWGDGLAWNNRPTWREQGEAWTRRLERGECTGISYSLVTNRPVLSGTTPTGYEPDPKHGTVADFRAMCRRLSDRGVPLLIWMSHSGLMHRGGPEIDDDWFIYGMDGRICAAWGSEDYPELAHINPGHPGYIAYTKKWIHFYLRECGCKGVWFDCLGWAFPADFRPRAFMRYPGDTNRMAIRFMDEIAAYVKELDPDAITGGEGASFDMPFDLISVNMNPVRAIDGRGPRDYLLELNRHGTKRIVLDQGPAFSAAGGMARALPGEENLEKNRCLAALLRDHGGPRAFTTLPGDLAIHDTQRLLVVPLLRAGHCGDAPAGAGGKPTLPPYPAFRLPPPWDNVTTLHDAVTAAPHPRAPDGSFRLVPPGVYRLG